MRKLAFSLIFALAFHGANAQNYLIDWSVIGSGGGHSQSSNHQLDGTIGQPIVGSSSSANYRIDAGFWVGAGGSGGGGCSYVPGDANGNGITNGIDVTYFVSYLKGGPLPPDVCDCASHGMLFAAADANGNCVTNGIDVTYMVSYFKGGPAIRFCPDCPPAGLNPPSPAIVPILAPATQPLGNLNVNN